MIRARKEGITPEQLIARSHEIHLKDFSDFQIAFDNYYTTNSPENKELSERIYSAAEKQGFITKKTTPQLYCEHCKMFLPDRFVKGTCPKCGTPNQYGDSCDHCGATYGAEELGSPKCTTCGETPVVKDSEHLYFELEPQHDYLEKWIPGHTTSDVSNKLLEWFKEPLRGWCISRDAPYFGFEIPGYKDKFFYVWVDAPIGYIASLTNWCKAHGRDVNDYWPTEVRAEGENSSPSPELYHFIGKDIIRFHCLFWPGMLNASGFKGPNKVFVHGFLTVNGEKMSKSKGTFVNARTYLDNLPPEALRYYYAAKLGGTTDDMDLNLQDFVQRVNSDLVGKITNIASRGGQMLVKKLDGKLGSIRGGEDAPAPSEGAALIEKCRAAGETIAKFYEDRRFNQVVVEICKLADAANEYFDKREPWKTVKTDAEATRTTLTVALNAFRIIAIYLKPILPVYADKAMKFFGESAWTWDSVNTALEGVKVCDYEYLASRIDQKQVDAMIAAATVKPADSGEVAHESRASKNKDRLSAAQPSGLSAVQPSGLSTAQPSGLSAAQPSGLSTAQPSGLSAAQPSGSSKPSGLSAARPSGVEQPALKGEIKFDDFEKLDLRVGVVESCEIVPKSSKLLKFVLDAGSLGKRTIFSGIRQAYPDPAALVGKEVVFVANLAPRKMSVGVSEGMILFAGEPGSCGGVLTPTGAAGGGTPVT